MPRLNADYDKQHANDAKTPEDGFANLFGDSKKKAAKLTTSVRALVHFVAETDQSLNIVEHDSFQPFLNTHSFPAATNVENLRVVIAHTVTHHTTHTHSFGSG